MPVKTSLRAYAKKYGVAPQTIANIKKEGINLDNETAVKNRLNKSSACPLQPIIPQSNSTPGLRGSIQRLQASELAAFEEYQTAKGTEFEGAKLRAWQGIVDVLRKVEVDNPDIEQANAETITKAELAAELGELFKNLRQDLDATPRRLALLCVGKDKFQIEQIMADEMARVIEALYQSKFLK